MGNPRGDGRHPREQLRRVMWPPHPQPPAPLQESPECGVCVRHDPALVPLSPHFQASQRHLNVQSPENLWSGREGPEAGGQATTLLVAPLFPPTSSVISRPASSI